MDLFQFIPSYKSAIFDTGREPALIMLLSFIVTYLITRGYTRIARKTGWGSANFGGVHTHHMVFGLIIALASSAIMFGFLPQQGALLLILAAAFGCGASLVLDEFALVFHLQDVYWEKEGRKSIDAVVLAIAFGSLFLLRVNPLGADENSPFLLFTIAINLVCVFISAFKGKVFLAMFGIFIPTLAQVGAIRLAEPDSIWARKFYKTQPKKMKKTKDRYIKYEKTWRHRKENAWDFIGGKPGRPFVNK